MNTIWVNTFGNRCRVQFGSLTAYGFCGINGATCNKREGDGKTPKGTFTIPFGFYQGARPSTALPMVKLHPLHRWIDDPRSPAYNRLLFGAVTDRCEVPDNIPQYALGLVANYNRSPTLAGLGSAIFVHCGNAPTAGCIALPYDCLLQIIKGLVFPPLPHIVIA